MFLRTVELMGTRDNAKTIDLSDVLPEEVFIIPLHILTC